MAWLLALVFATLAVSTRRCWLPGEGPFDAKPSGTDDEVIALHDVKARSGRSYQVTAFRRFAQVYYVAVRTDSKDWISYLHDPRTKVRVMYRANAASEAALANLREDFAV